MERADAWTTALQLCERHGVEEASLIAWMQAGECADIEDERGYRAWRRVSAALRILSRSRPMTPEA